METQKISAEELKSYFLENYPYISLELSSKELEKFISDYSNRFSIKVLANFLSDYILANNLGEVVE